MNRKLLSLGVMALLATGATAQIITNTVSVGANYVNQKWYSLENGEVGTAQSKDNWDIAFEASGYSSAIIANTQKANFAIYYAPFKIADYGVLDTVGIKNWPMLYNSDTTWTVGAFNRGADPSNASDLGWGVYDMNTHFVNGDSCFVVKLSATSFKKLKIVSLANGTYNFEYADINGANSSVQAVAKASYTSKNFVYFDMSTNAIVDREPASASWDLTFGRYTATLYMPSPTPYPVVGIMQNKNVTVAQADNVTNPASYSDWTNQTYNTNITVIGHDWKTINLSTNAWGIVNDTVYFVKDRAGYIWKVRPVSFGGSANGDFVFTKEKMGTFTGVADNKGQLVSKVLVYPNPANANGANLIFSSDVVQNVAVSVIDMNGKVISSETMNVSEGLNTYGLSTANLQSGVYFVSLNAGSFTSVQKLIVH